MNKTLKQYLDSDEWLKDLFDNAHDLIQLVRADGILLYVNRAWCTLLGYTQSEIEGRSIYEFIPDDHHRKYRDYRENVMKGGDTERGIAFDLLNNKGERLTVEGFVSVKTEEGRPVYTRGIFRDITTRLKNENRIKQANEELREREMNLHKLLVNAPDAVVVIDQDSLVTFWNPKAESLFGWKEEEVMNQSLSKFIIPVQHREAHDNGMKRYLSTGEAHVLNRTIEITALNKQGAEFFVSLTISETQQNKKRVFIAFIRDITEQKNNQTELERKSKELERSNQNLQEFAHAASHDLKEPIRKIHFFSDRLKQSLRDQLNQNQINFFERMELASRRMGQLIDDLLQFSEVTQAPALMEDINLNEKVARVREDLELLIEEKGAQIEVGPLPVIRGHRRQMQQLFQNLIGNSLKYSKPGVPPVIQISSAIVDRNELPFNQAVGDNTRRYHKIEIKDNGIGFQQQDVERMFQVFQRLHSNSEYTGSGVGLSIVRKVVENHKGFISAKGELNVGACFDIFLPER